VRAGTAQDLFRNGTSQQETKETWLGEIPENWDVVQFSEIVDSNRNGLYKSTDAYGEGCPIAKMGNALEKRTLDMSSADRLELTDKEKEKYGLKKGDLIFARRAQEVSAAGDCCYVPQLDELTVFESSLIRVRLSEEANPRFYTQYFDSPVGSRSIERIVTETSISGIATSDLLDLKVAVPNPDEQSEIASIMWQFDRQEMILQREIEQYERLKRGLMQDLLSGTVRTTDTNIEVPEEIAQYG
jgi:type I restriction enzyme S subunit